MSTGYLLPLTLSKRRHFRPSYLLAIPASSTTSTTFSTFLYALGASSDMLVIDLEDPSEIINILSYEEMESFVITHDFLALRN